MIEEQMNEMAEAFLRWPLPDDVCADDCACKAGAPNRTGTNLLTAHQALAMIRFVCRPELTAMYADVERLSAELAALRADAERLEWYFGPASKADWLDTFMTGVRENWTVDQWRAAIDAAIAKGEGMNKRTEPPRQENVLNPAIAIVSEKTDNYLTRRALGPRKRVTGDLT